LAVLAVAGCGTDEEAEQARTAAEEELQDLRVDLEKAEETVATGKTCEDELKNFIRQLGDLDGLLNVGLNYAKYSDQVQQISIAYNRIDFDGLDLDCVSEVGLGAEKSFRQFAKAQDVWGDCQTDLDCDSDSIEPELQRSWGRAASSLTDAEAGLESSTDDAEAEVVDLEQQISEVEAELADLE
jgi:hypothetical protein